jgi:hypothetical protein
MARRERVRNQILMQRRIDVCDAALRAIACGYYNAPQRARRRPATQLIAKRRPIRGNGCQLCNDF